MAKATINKNQGKRVHPIDQEIGRRIRMRRMLLGMSQEKLGDAIGLTFQQVQKYEKGVNRVSGSRLSRIADILNVTPAFFFQKKDNSSDENKADDELAKLVDRADTIRLLRAFQFIEGECRAAMVHLAESCCKRGEGQ